MATFKCPDCNNTVSDKADFCPKCGRKVTYQDAQNYSRNNNTSLLKIAFLTLVVDAVVSFCLSAMFALVSYGTIAVQGFDGGFYTLAAVLFTPSLFLAIWIDDKYL